MSVVDFNYLGKQLRFTYVEKKLLLKSGSAQLLIENVEEGLQFSQTDNFWQVVLNHQSATPIPSFTLQPEIQLIDKELQPIIKVLHNLFTVSRTTIEPQWISQQQEGWALFNNAQERLKCAAHASPLTGLIKPPPAPPLSGKVMAAMLIMALLSSFTMADGAHDSITKDVILGLGMLGAAVFNYMGAAAFLKTRHESSLSWSCIVCGVLSAIAPAVMTFFGVSSFPWLGAYYILPVLASVANFLFSAALGAKGTEQIWKTIVDFLEGDHHSIFDYGIGKSGRIFTRVLAVIELILYTILSFYLMSSRVFATVKMMQDFPKGKVDLRTLKKGSWYWGSISAATVSNLPEGALFLMCILKLRMKSYRVVQHLYRCHKGVEQFNYYSLISFAAAIGMAFSFYKVFNEIGETAAEETFEDWAKNAETLFTDIFTNKKYMGQYAGIAATLLVIGEGATLTEMFNIFLAGCKLAFAECQRCSSCQCCCQSKTVAYDIRGSGFSDTTPLLPQTVHDGLREVKETTSKWRSYGSWWSWVSSYWPKYGSVQTINSKNYESI